MLSCSFLSTSKPNVLCVVTDVVLYFSVDSIPAYTSSSLDAQPDSAAQRQQPAPLLPPAAPLPAPAHPALPCRESHSAQRRLSYQLSCQGSTGAQASAPTIVGGGKLSHVKHQLNKEEQCGCRGQGQTREAGSKRRQEEDEEDEDEEEGDEEEEEVSAYNVVQTML